MKSILSLLVLIFLPALQVSAQQASDYFPADPGYKWHYRVGVLDSLNNPVDSLTLYQIDTVLTTDTWKGKTSKFLGVKYGTYELVNFIPVVDTQFVSLNNTNAETYIRPAALNALTGLIDSTLIDSLLGGFNIFGFIGSFEGWYNPYRFANNVNSSYTIVRKDTTVTLDTLTLPLRFEARGRRISDGPVTTEIGTFNCKKFIMSYTVAYLPLPILPIPLLTINDTVYIAPGNWIVKTIAPSTLLDLNALQLGIFTIPGLKREIINPIPIVSVEDEITGAADFTLSQNYPNPFNPETRISFSLNTPGNVKLNLYSPSGELVKVISEGYFNTGRHSVLLNASDLSSGVYFYSLETPAGRMTKKLTLLK